MEKIEELEMRVAALETLLATVMDASTKNAELVVELVEAGKVTAENVHRMSENQNRILDLIATINNYKLPERMS